MKRYRVIVPIKGELSCYLDGPDNATLQDILNILHDMNPSDFELDYDQDKEEGEIEYYAIHKVEE